MSHNGFFGIGRDNRFSRFSRRKRKEVLFEKGLDRLSVGDIVYITLSDGGAGKVVTIDEDYYIWVSLIGANGLRKPQSFRPQAVELKPP